MSKKASKKSVAETESFLDDAAATASVSPAAAPAATKEKAKRTYKPRSAKAAVKGGDKQAAWQQGFKAGVAFAEMGA